MEQKDINEFAGMVEREWSERRKRRRGGERRGVGNEGNILERKRKEIN